MLLAYDIAREINTESEKSGGKIVRAVFARTNPDSVYPDPKLLDGFNIKPKEDVLIVNDVATTGHGLQTLINLANSYRANIRGISIFATRRNMRDGGCFDEKLTRIIKQFGDKFHEVIELDVGSWDKKECHLCMEGFPFVKSSDISSIEPKMPLAELLAPLRPGGLRVA